MMVDLITAPEFWEPLAEWAAERIPHARNGFGPSAAVGLVAEGELGAVAVFSDWRPEYATAQLSVVVERRAVLSETAMGEVLRWAFDGGLGAPLRKLRVIVPHTHRRAINMAKRRGFKLEAVLREEFGPKVHASVFGMLDREFRRRFG